MSALLIIAGTDSSGGAGLTRDIAAATAMAQMLPLFAQRSLSLRPVVTAITVQTDTALEEIRPTPPEVIKSQIRAAAATGPISAVKIGMVGSAMAAEVIAKALAHSVPETCPVVLDPVLRSSSGGQLMQATDLKPLIARATLITPNLQEVAQLAPCPIDRQPGSSESCDIASQARQLQQAHQLQKAGADAVLIKGGHGDGAMSVDQLFFGDTHVRYDRPRLPRGRRGTGCTLATAIAVQLMAGQNLDQACARAGDYVHEWLKEVAT
ncbi:bifunctional hydroxymethylpyrimidine kinase/phosphomethylpyrimidine kinase [Phaeobacter gallaeciensis]|uniref:bifunctional hydroxymethylpyrimidine kinase/phosphomethylpyrimidine kinase n=1 Tax=Phaeobacter gallaeciensis TaxID=60890 RepID=UPI000BBBE1D6|nr:hydroxymethylpyrimidine/phosphomethylpyrimidine kinase [Phaeobacter gallaeciensis]ATF19050.1 Hydroxymethylpyrimidine/phosphomethylpyrimidine kinase [Phaeobacter gallaeciensis]ATF23159.1 Hydroxymethylpyrimidine/phosphomethylpyrimidine kinase [Phaeobacter gallaeciensis]